MRAPDKDRFTLEDLIVVMKALRTPVTGCPWDLEQTFATIAPYTIEEAYEVADAIDRADMKDLREELGDLLLQPIYHAQMASEVGAFTIHDVIHDITAKMIARHPHVFGDQTAKTADDVNAIWDKKKAQEKSGSSALDGVTNALPALLKAQKLQAKAAKVGFTWTELPRAKLAEELAELEHAITSGSPAEQAEELGDVLFVLANYGRMLGINPEEALRQCTRKFEQRFRGIESDLHARGRTVQETSLAELEALWRAQKTKVSQG